MEVERKRNWAIFRRARERKKGKKNNSQQPPPPPTVYPHCCVYKRRLASRALLFLYLRGCCAHARNEKGGTIGTTTKSHENNRLSACQILSRTREREGNNRMSSARRCVCAYACFTVPGPRNLLDASDKKFVYARYMHTYRVQAPRVFLTSESPRCCRCYCCIFSRHFEFRKLLSAFFDIQKTPEEARFE